LDIQIYQIESDLKKGIDKIITSGYTLIKKEKNIDKKTGEKMSAKFSPISGSTISMAFEDIKPQGTNQEFENLYSQCQEAISRYNDCLEVDAIERAKYYKQIANQAYLKAKSISKK
jgi:hypothetical protein